MLSEWSHSHFLSASATTHLGAGCGTETLTELIQLTVVAENKPSKEVHGFLLRSELNCHSKGPVSITVQQK